MPEPELPQVRWRKSSHSSANGQCVEVAPVAGAIAVRDSKNPAGPKLIFTRQAWMAFVESVKCGPDGGTPRAGQPGQESR